MRIQAQGFLLALSQALDCVERDLVGATTNHSKRAAFISTAIAQAMGLSDVDCFDMSACALLHDNALTAYLLEAGERALRLEDIVSHCAIGEKNAHAFPFAGNAVNVVLQHHENWDGSGFYKLKGKKILTRASALRLADNIDVAFALGSGDILEDGSSRLEAVANYVREHRETWFDPTVADAFLDLWTPEMQVDIADANIDASLNRDLPLLDYTLNSEQVLRLCDLFAGIIDAKSPFTSRHSRGIAEKAGQMARYFHFNPEHKDFFVTAAYLHDIGKLATPSVILEKNGPLDTQEFEVIREHPALTESILGNIPGFEKVAHWAASHHEKLNGTGYPHQQGEQELDMECRLLTCIDIYQALTEDRPYRVGMCPDRALQILDEMAQNGHVDATMAQAMRAVYGSTPNGVPETVHEMGKS